MSSTKQEPEDSDAEEALLPQAAGARRDPRGSGIRV